MFNDLDAELTKILIDTKQEKWVDSVINEIDRCLNK